MTRHTDRIRFMAVEKDGNQHEILGERLTVETQTRGGPVITREKKWRLSIGALDVIRIDRGHYKIKKTGTELRSTDPMAI